MNQRKRCKGCYQAVPAEGPSRCPQCAGKHNATEAERRAAKNPQEKWNAAGALQRAKEYSAPGRWTDREMAELARAFGNACVYCGAPAEVADHFVPLSSGGTNCEREHAFRWHADQAV
jgi:5-methylcytosine-specific restriction endonuclease McrA